MYDSGLLSAISYVLVGRERFESPFQLVLPVALVVAVLLARFLRRRYDGAIRGLPGDELSAADLRSVPAGRSRLAVWLGITLVWYVQLALSPAEVADFVAAHGTLVVAAKYLTVSPLYYLAVADVVALVVASLVVLPWRLYNTRLTLDFSDVTGFAGLYGTGRLLLAATAVYYVGLTAWSAFLVAPNIVGTASDVSGADTVVFAALWLAGLLLYLAPTFLLHRHMAREKARLIRAIDAEIRELDPDGERKGVPYLTPNREDIPTLQQKYIELQQVRTAREYPADVTTAGELAAATLVPVLLQWGLRVVPL
ncbi:hypothetical protein [Halosegnis marinus]|uniref:hypothetical protein n=1 Tax=Halosegnis marinus TaxID=3034023 RepID=UPI003621D2D5